MDSDLKHRLIAEIKRLAADLGRVPTRDEFASLSTITNSRRLVDSLFGGFSVFKQSVGIKEQPSKKIIKERVGNYFSGNLAEALSKASKKSVNPFFSSFEPCLLLGDFHLPWWHEESISIIYAVAEYLYSIYDERLHIVQLGDLYDMYSWAKFPKSIITYNPKEEIEISFKLATTFWQTINKLAPGAKKVQLRGNHDERAHKRVIESTPANEPFFSVSKYFVFENVKTIFDAREILKIGDLNIHHGFASGPGAHISKLRTNAHGHTHRGGIMQKKIEGKWYSELDCGYLGDISKKCFHYTPVKEPGWTLGFGLACELGLFFNSLE